METSVSKFFLFFFLAAFVIWVGSSLVKNYEAGKLFKFGTVEFQDGLDPSDERTTYRVFAEDSIIAYFCYPAALVTGIGYVLATRRSFARNGWLLMSAILFFIFIPVELYCFWLDWKIVGLNYWGNWPMEEFRKAMLHRMTALAGLPLIAQLCYCTIPIFIIFKPLQKPEA